MLGIQNFDVFLITTIIFIIVPGIDAMFVLSRSVSNGRASGIASSAGIATGAFIHTILSTVGLSLLLSQSIVLFTALKIIGGLYLIYIGIKSIVQKSDGIKIKQVLAGSLKKDYWQGVITNVANPKNILFYLSFLPQFVSTDSVENALPFLILGATFSLVVLIWYISVSFFTSFATKGIKDSKLFNTIMNKVSGVVFVGLGVKLMSSK